MELMARVSYQDPVTGQVNKASLMLPAHGFDVREKLGWYSDMAQLEIIESTFPFPIGHAVTLYELNYMAIGLMEHKHPLVLKSLYAIANKWYSSIIQALYNKDEIVAYEVTTYQDLAQQFLNNKNSHRYLPLEEQTEDDILRVAEELQASGKFLFVEGGILYKKSKVKIDSNNKQIA
jgi:hypothetical protein